MRIYPEGVVEMSCGTCAFWHPLHRANSGVGNCAMLRAFNTADESGELMLGVNDEPYQKHGDFKGIRTPRNFGCKEHEDKQTHRSET